jgi:hypothetical protein
MRIGVRILWLCLLVGAVCCGWAQEPETSAAETSPQTDTAAPYTGHAFAATKYARRVRILADGSQKFLRNERYPVRIGRDAKGRLRMQTMTRDEEWPDCRWIDKTVPPECSSWGVVVIDPVKHTLAHWVEGEIGAHSWIDFPLDAGELEKAAHLTNELPGLAPPFSEEDGKMTHEDLGEQQMDGISAHGERWTLHYQKNVDGKPVERVRIHETWVSEELRLVVRVVDGNPRGAESIWGLEKITTAPDASLFEPPADHVYHPEHGHGSRFYAYDFEYLATWFEK